MSRDQEQVTDNPRSFAGAKPGDLKILGIATHTVDHFADLPLWRYSMSFVYLKAYLRQFPEWQQVAFEMCNYYTNDSVEKIMADVRRLKPDVVLFSAYVWNMLLYQELARAIKDFDPRLRIVLGGPEVACETRQLLADNPAFDVIARGEGEHVFYELVRALLGDHDLGTVDGLTFRRGEELVRNADNTFLALHPLDTIPSVFEPEIYDWSTLAGSFVAIETQRGCNFSCGFCRYRKVGQGARFFDLDRVLRELDYIATLGCRHLYLMDPTFNNKPDRAKTLLRHVIDLDMGVTINAEMIPEMMDRELLELSLQAGMRNLEVGVQAVKKPVLRIMQRPRNDRMLLEKIDLASSIEVGGQKLNVIPQIIYGLPGDTFETYRESFDFLYQLDVEEVAMYHLLVLRDTQFYLDREKHGLVYHPDPPHRLISCNTFPADDLTLAAKMSCAAMGTQYTLRPHIRSYCRKHGIRPTELFLDRVGVDQLDDAMVASFPIHTRPHLDAQLACLERVRSVFEADGMTDEVDQALTDAENLFNARLGVIERQAEGERFQFELEELEAELLALEGLRGHAATP